MRVTKSSMLMMLLLIVIPSVFAATSTKLDNLYAKPKATKEERAFICNLQTAVKNNDKRWIAARIFYPITVNVNGRNKEIKDIREFEKYYTYIINGDVKQAVLRQDINNLFKNSEGVMIGNGEIWIMTAKFTKSHPQSVLIVTINNEM
jgi:hypothetical protein